MRLTTGGEPTFVSVDDMEAPEWNIAAVGPAKRGFADQLIRRLRTRFAPGGLLHYGQGKWYPGESLPRWAFGLYWRMDGLPIWKNAELIAPIENPRRADIADAERFAQSTAEKLGVASEFVLPAFEDPTHWLQKEAALPANVDPGDSKLADPEERARMARVFDAGLNNPRGYVLPIQRWNADAGRWKSERWDLRRGHLFLIPGDSPLGLRLPIASLPYIPAEDYPYVVEQDPLEPRGDLPLYEPAAFTGAPQQMVQEQQVRSGGVRTAMSIEIRDGVLCAFMPPVEKVEDYLELVAAVEATAEEIQMPVHVEGYPPPFDPRVDVIKVTPDPGVIEVNVQPATSWRQAVDITLGLYEDAAQERLGANKFLLDGRHTGTGGGNHVVVGGATPNDSPFLRRPDLLEEPRAVLAAASVAVLFLLRHVHRADQPGAADRRGASRQSLRAGNRARPRAAARRQRAALAGRPPVPAHPGRHHRQHPSRRNLHRQALFARQRHRPAGPGRIPRASRCRRIRGCSWRSSF